jgi:hypothetical protein
MNEQCCGNSFRQKYDGNQTDEINMDEQACQNIKYDFKNAQTDKITLDEKSVECK